MEKWQIRRELARPASITGLVAPTAAPATTDGNLHGPHWREHLPLLVSSQVMLREMRAEDAPALLSMVGTPEVKRFISPPPGTVDAFERFIDWSNHERTAGRSLCFAAVPQGLSAPVGIFQLRSVESAFQTAEWGCVLGSPFWGTGLFVDGAQLLFEFAFDILGTRRLEARTAVANGRGNGALRKLGAVQEGVLRRAFLRDGQYLDQVLWSVLAEDWRMQRTAPLLYVH